MTAYFDTREQWLMAAVQELEPRFSEAGLSIPAKIKVSCGFGIGARGGKKILGQCFSPEVSHSGNTEIFISPIIDDPLKVIGVLAHQLVHACIGNDKGHGEEFKRAGAAVGLWGNASEMLPGAEMHDDIMDNTLPILGTYPHAALDDSKRKRQTTRLIKCVSASGYSVWTTKKHLDIGYPVDPDGNQCFPKDGD